jgi:hypothetical protein
MANDTITMSVSARVYQACQLDDGSIRAHYGLTPVPSNGRKGYWFTGSEAAWRELADDVEQRSSGHYADGATYPSDGLHGRITKHLSKRAA